MANLESPPNKQNDEPMVSRQIRFPKGLLKKLQQWADDDKRDLSNLVRKILSEAVEKEGIVLRDPNRINADE